MKAGIDETARLVAELDGKALPVVCDVTSAEDVDAAVRATVDNFGRLDAAFNNAGIEQPVAPLAEISPEASTAWSRSTSRGLQLHAKPGSGDVGA